MLKNKFVYVPVSYAFLNKRVTTIEKHCVEGSVHLTYFV